jgi:transcriptional regulator with GAF, ATPase, and Fis domain
MAAKLKIISEKGKGEIFELTAAEISIGRDKANEIVLNDASVSRRHCVIERRGETFSISDSASLNGTSVNGREAFETTLSGGDRIEVGDFTFAFLTGDTAEESSGVFFDKTEFRLPKNSLRLRLEDVFGAMARDLTALLRISTALNSIRETEKLQKELLRQIFEVVPAFEGAILLVDAENQLAEIVGLNRLDDGEWVNVSQTVVNQVLQTRQVILIGDPASSAENLPEAESLFLRKISSLLCVPVVLYEKTLGVIYLSSSKSNFDEGHLKFLTAVAGLAAVAIENARNFAFLETENARLRGETLNRNMLGESLSMEKVFELIRKVAPTDSTVLINGESGTGKELAAQAIHLNSRRRDRPFVAINCAALTETLLESELFGHEKGAFTGAAAQKKGKIETAQGGTLFLDEIGEMALNLQAKLLRVLQEREFDRVGGTRPVKADIRLIAATNRDLSAEVKNGRFRQDLFYRLNVVRFTMPALRERKDDILLLAESFVEKFARILNRRIRGISANAKKLLLKYDFPGNVRELENAIERAAVLGSGDWILPEDLPEDFLELRTETGKHAVSKYHEALREKKIELIRGAFREAKGNYVETARILDIHPNYLHRLIKNLEIKGDLERPG